MARASATAENAGLAGLAGQNPSNQIPFGSLHTADPGTTGASEYAGVTRIASTWGTPSAGSMANTATETYTTSGASAVTYFGQWSLVSAGVYGIGGALTSSVTAVSIAFASGAKTITQT